MAKMPFFKFFPHDWLFDTRICTDEEARVLIDMLCYMWNAPQRGILAGSPQDLARLLGREWLNFSAIVDSLKRKNIIDVTLGNDEVTLVSRRMAREEKSRESGRLRKNNFDRRNGNAKVTDKKSEAKKLDTPIVPFGDFYNLYPKKQARAHAERVWGLAFQKAILTQQLWESKVRPALVAQIASENWQKEGGKFVPFPATWIRQKRWEDQLHPATEKRQVVG